jgi:RNA polymerase sigma-70 factor (ECF subfamily)
LVLRELGPEILAFLRALLRDEDDAQDAFQSFAEDVWTGLPSFRWESSLRTWAYRLAANQARNQRRDAWRRKGRRLATEEYSHIAEEVRSGSKLRDERQRRTLDLLREELDLDDRALLVLRLDRKLTWDEVAQVLSSEGPPVAPNSMAKRFERLKDRLGTAARKKGLVD